MKVLLADDDYELTETLRYIFQREGYTVLIARDGLGAWNMFQIESPDLLILDNQMPKRTGLEVLRAVRAMSHVPVMMLTVASDETSIVRALELGADDYMSKPFGLGELRARARALLRRRHSWTEQPLKHKQVLTCNQLVLDPNTRLVTIEGEAIRLTPTEFSLLHYLMLNVGIVVNTGSILENVWGYGGEESDEVVRVTISRLRKKIEPNPLVPQYILNLPGVGYKLECTPS